MYDKNILAKRMRGLRQGKNLTQRQLAEKSNTTAASISAYEKGQKTPSIEVLCNIAAALDTSVDWLCGQKTSESKMNTYADVIKHLLLALNSIDYQIAIFEVQGSDIPYIEILDDEMEQFIQKLWKVKELKDQEVMDDDIFGSWLDGQLIKYNIPIKEKNKNKTSIDYTKYINSDEDLPF